MQLYITIFFCFRYQAMRDCWNSNPSARANFDELIVRLESTITTYTPFTPAKHVLLNWFSLNENYKQRTEKLDFPLDSSTC